MRFASRSSVGVSSCRASRCSIRTMRRSLARNQRSMPVSRCSASIAPSAVSTAAPSSRRQSRTSLGGNSPRSSTSLGRLSQRVGAHLQRAHRLLQRRLEGAIDRHHLAGRLHLRAEAAVGERETCRTASAES